MTAKPAGCEKCVHKTVCALRENRSKLDSALKDMEKLPEYREFTLNVSCRYYYAGQEHINT